MNARVERGDLALATRLIVAALALILAFAGFPASASELPTASVASCCCGGATPRPCCASRRTCCAPKPDEPSRAPRRDSAPAAPRCERLAPAPVLTLAPRLPALAAPFLATPSFAVSPAQRRLHLRLAHFLE